MRGVVSWRPGRFTVQARAPDHEDHEQTVVLVRGQSSTVVIAVELVPKFGFCRISSDPEFSEVEILDAKGRVIARGATPFASPRLPSGEYRARVRKDGYFARAVTVVVPTGERVRETPLVKLTPMERMTEGVALMTFMRKLDRVVDFAGLDDPKATLIEVLDQLATVQRISFDRDEASFKEEGLKDVLRTEIANPNPIPPQRCSLRTVIQKICARVPIPSGVEFIPVMDKGAFALRLLTGRRAAETRFTILHPVGDLTTGPDGQPPERLLAAVREHIGRLSVWDSKERRFKDRNLPDSALRYLPTAGVFYTSLPWSSQERVTDYLDELRKATLGLKRNEDAYNTLGNTLVAQRRWDEAVAAYRKAIQLQPDHAEAYRNLGAALDAQNKPGEARAAYRKAIDRQTDCTEACNLGNTLAAQGRWDEAAAAYHKAIALDPSSALAHYDLGNALEGQKKPDEARAAYRKAIDLTTASTEASRLGEALYQRENWDTAAAAYRKAIKLEADQAPAHNGLGLALVEQGKLEEAVAAFRKADQMAPKRFVYSHNLAVAERWLQLERKLPACLAGKERPASPREGVELGCFCALFQQYRAAVRFYADAFKEDPNVAYIHLNWATHFPTAVGNAGRVAHVSFASENWYITHRYRAACCALRAAVGMGKDATGLDDKERTTLRLQVLDWLQTDLKGYIVGRPWVIRSGGKEKWVLFHRPDREVQNVLRRWQSDPDLSSVRETAGLAKLPEAERKQWQKLWADAGALLRGPSRNRVFGVDPPNRR
jgi:tetratricopeptide (TPR) repeat protein